MAAPDQRTLYILWFAFCMSVCVFGVVAVVSTPPDAEGLDLTTAAILGATAPVMWGLGLLAPGPFRKQPALNGWIIRFAFIEAGALHGFVLHFLGNRLPGAALMGVGLFLMLSLVPTADRVVKWEMNRLG